MTFTWEYLIVVHTLIPKSQISTNLSIKFARLKKAKFKIFTQICTNFKSKEAVSLDHQTILLSI